AAVAGDDHGAQGLDPREGVEGGEEAIDQRAVIGVVDLRPVEDEPGDRALIDAPQHGAARLRWAHDSLPPTGLRRQQLAPHRWSDGFYIKEAAPRGPVGPPGCSVSA